MPSSKLTGGPLVDWSSVISIDYIDWLWSGNSDFLEDAVEETLRFCVVLMAGLAFILGALPSPGFIEHSVTSVMR